jgi:hypothetical protein
MSETKIIPRKELTKKDVAWAWFDNHDASATMHHLLYNEEVKEKWTGETVIKNRFACRAKWRVYDENEKAQPIENNEATGNLNRNAACKSCLKFYDQLPEQLTQ